MDKKQKKLVDAIQWFEDGDHPAVKMNQLYGRYYVKTLDGELQVRPGDWIITTNGEHYPCKPDVFGKTYEAVE